MILSLKIWRSGVEATAWRYWAALAVAASLASCKVGPDYKRPDLGPPAAYKSATPQEAAQPKLGWDWWRLFGDEELNNLEAEAMRANNDLTAAMARVIEARAAAKAVASQFYPQITADPSIIRSRTSGNSLSTKDKTSNRGRTFTDTQVPFDLSYEIDIWGRVRRSVEVAQAQAQASADDLAVVRQTVAADLAQGYFNLRSLDTQDSIIDRNVGLFRRQLALTQTKLKAGLVAQTDVLQAQTVLDSVLAQQTDTRRQRADQEHAIAILLGRPPARLTLPVRPQDLTPPSIPAGLPGDLLRRRPDVAEAEQNLVAASAQIGVDQANFYPVIKLTGAAGFESVDIAKIFDWESRVWSLGPTMTVPVFKGGQLRANLEQDRAKYQEVLANYRSAVLGAFRDVEDALSDLHLRAEQAQAQARAVDSSREYLRLAQVQYDQGLTDYLQVIDADRTLLTNELTAEQIRSSRMASAVLLMKALGGGWDPDKVESPRLEDVTARQPAATQP